MIYFLDTNVCIRFLNGSSQGVLDRFEEIDFDDIVIPSIVAAELMHGAYKSAKRDYNLNRFREFINQFKIIGLSSGAIETYGQIRLELEQKGTPIGANDYFIAAIALASSGTLVTNNTREFSRIQSLLLEDWSIG